MTPPDPWWVVRRISTGGTFKLSNSITPRRFRSESDGKRWVHANIPKWLKPDCRVEQERR